MPRWSDLFALEEWIDNGCAVALQITDQDNESFHSITCHGVEFGADRRSCTLWYTDSDNDPLFLLNEETLTAALRDDGYWEFEDDTVLYKDYVIVDMFTLRRNWRCASRIEITEGGFGPAFGEAWRTSGSVSTQLLAPETDNYAAFLTASSPASLSQTVDTPAASFCVAFDFMFVDGVGELEILLDGTLLERYPAVQSEELLATSLLVTDEELLSLEGAELTFLWNGPPGSRLLLDNVVSAGIFVPDPGTLVLLAAGGLLLVRRRRRTK